MGRWPHSENLKKIIDAIRESPKSYSELSKLVPGSTLDRYLIKYLSNWKLIYKGEDGRWRWFQDQTIYRNEQEYEIALKHSENIVIPMVGSETIRANPFYSIDELTLLEYESLSDVDLALFKNHLKTGYPETYDKMLKYKEMLIEHDLIDRPHIPKLSCFIEFDHGDIYDREVSFYSSIKEGFSYDPEAIFDSGKELELVFNLRDNLVGEIYSIINEVKNGIPLKGHCQACPSNKIMLLN